TLVVYSAIQQYKSHIINTISLYFYFFFQAEDGIRDFHVTGVQTCALPIFGQCLAWGGVNQPAVATRTLGREVDDAGHLRGDVRVRNPQLLARGHEVRVPVGVPTPGVRVTQQPHQLGRHHRPPVGVRVSEGHDLVGLVQLERLRRDRAWNLAAGLHHQRVVPQLRGTDTPDAVESGGAVVVVVGAARSEEHT